MEVADSTVQVVLKKDRRFIVPLYQRKYQWGDDRTRPFWEDVANKAVEVLEGESRFQHYLGALILTPIGSGSSFTTTPVVQVVDGQQRLTTFQLFLLALREVARDWDLEKIIKSVEKYIYNDPEEDDDDPLTKYKLTPTPSDRELFHDLVDLPYKEVRKKYKKLYYGGSVPKKRTQKALRAYQLFCEWIEDFVDNGPHNPFEPEDFEIIEENEPSDEECSPENAEARLKALMSALLDRLKLVVIDLGEDDDAQVIFETLNSKGEPLLAMDLVRNNIFHRAEKQKAPVETLYKNLWDPMDDPWWREPALNARPTRPRIDHFLAHVLAAETGNKISMRELYAEYRNFAVPTGKPHFENVEDELKLLEHYAPIYQTLEGQEDGDPALMWLGRKLADWQVTTVYPVALQMGAEDVSTDTREQLSQLIYSYIVRRALCGLTTKNMNKVFQSIAGEFVKNGVSVSGFKKFFAEKAGASSKFPSDREFRNGILTGKAYSIAPKPRLVDILDPIHNRV